MNTDRQPSVGLGNALSGPTATEAVASQPAAKKIGRVVDGRFETDNLAFAQWALSQDFTPAVHVEESGRCVFAFADAAAIRPLVNQFPTLEDLHRLDAARKALRILMAAAKASAKRGRE